MFERVKAFYRGHEPACTAGFFAAGFLFDTLAVGRIDKWLNILHQAVYLSLCAYFTCLELRETHGRFTPPERLKTAWRCTRWCAGSASATATCRKARSAAT